MKSCFPWVGGKAKLLWLISKLFPSQVNRFVDVFGGSGTVLLSRPIRKGCIEIYNDFNSNLTNLFFCIKKRPFALLRELAFLPLNSRDGFSVLLKFLRQEEFTDDYLQENLDLAQQYLSPVEFEEARALLLERAELGDVQRAAAYYKVIRYSFSGSTSSFAGKPCDIRHFFHLIWDCSRRLADVVVENKDFAALIRQYDRKNTLFYCDPPYFQAEKCYQVQFTKADHHRLHHRLRKCKGFVMVSYNDCPFIRKLYRDFYIYHTDRHNSMSQKAGSKYEEIIMTNYDPQRHIQQMTMFDDAVGGDGKEKYILIHRPNKELWEANNAKENSYHKAGAPAN
ncbi:D12 class N6 adenine-specific DNA methyltransferase [anaerobic digester metagenome]